MTHTPPGGSTLEPDLPTPAPPPSRDALNRELVRRHQAGDREALGELIEANSALVETIASLSFDRHFRKDLYQAGVIGLMRAADKFDPGAGVRFSTYAGYWIRCTIQEERRISGRPSPIIVPKAMKPGGFYRKRAKARDIASADQALALRECTGSEGGDSHLDTVPDDRSTEWVEHADEIAWIRRLVAGLPGDLATVVISRHGLDGGEPLTLAEIGPRIGKQCRKTVWKRYRQAIAMLQEMVGVEPKPRKRRKPGEEG